MLMMILTSHMEWEINSFYLSKERQFQKAIGLRLDLLIVVLFYNQHMSGFQWIEVIQVRWFKKKIDSSDSWKVQSLIICFIINFLKLKAKISSNQKHGEKQTLYGELKTNLSNAIRLIQPDSVIFFLVFLTPFKIRGRIIFWHWYLVDSDERNLPNYLRFTYRKESTQNYVLVLLKKEIQNVKVIQLVCIPKLMRDEKH